MSLPLLAPVTVLIGVFGTRTAYMIRHKGRAGTSDWWLLLILSWSPLIIWALAQVVDQY